MTEGGDDPVHNLVPVVVLDVSALDDLVELFDGDPQVARDFVGGYLGLIGPRQSRLQDAVRAEEPENAVVALLSLQNASAMVGAQQVAHRCGWLLEQVRELRWTVVRADLPRLTRDVGDAARALGEWDP
ncbi:MULTISPECIES: hypothetical protein [Desertihabitans]|uniref:Hpt domain-containing protein n=1 Tax=Desertihabitans brevis TaxID=2268447 RepID=A0A367YT73_9ACTN|nr:MULTISPECIES: hypothetical protein [Desertihabitans]RCK68739.1 hypothetical protein DT076_14225 [Desertihabitans brevis]